MSEPPSLSRPVVAGFALVALAVVAGVGSLVFSQRAERWAAHSMQVRGFEVRLYAGLLSAETGQRGYLLTGDRSYLRPFQQSAAQVPEVFRRLSALTADSAEQHQRLVRLRPVVDAKLAELQRTVALRDAGRGDEALAVVRSNRGRDLMRAVVAQLHDFDVVEQRLQAEREATAQRARWLLAGVGGLAVLAFGALAVLVARAGRGYGAAMAAQNARLVEEIAHREQAEAQLRQAQKMEAVGQLTGGVAHDFNNMLAVIVGSLDLLRRRAAGQPRLEQLAERALEGAQRAADLTKRLLAFSRLQPLEPRAVDVNVHIRDLSEMIRRTLGDHIGVETVLAGGLWPAFIDPAQLASAVLNLAVNARDAMPDGGRLTIETGNAALDQAYADRQAELNPGQYVMVAVTDTGRGMAPEVAARAFDPFFTTKAVGSGTGLGLSQVHGFIKQSGGHVKIYSEPGAGTTVKLYLPRARGTPALATTARSEGARLPPASVLVVEDTDEVRAFAVTALVELGLHVQEAATAEAALEILRQAPEIDLLLTDVVMPGVDGRRLADAARVLRPDLKVLFMTGYTRNAIVHNGRLDPGVRLLTKPFTVDDLGRELRAVLTAGPAAPA